MLFIVLLCHRKGPRSCASRNFSLFGEWSYQTQNSESIGKFFFNGKLSMLFS